MEGWQEWEETSPLVVFLVELQDGSQREATYAGGCFESLDGELLLTVRRWKFLRYSAVRALYSISDLWLASE
jgi:hypothetical protein